MCKSVKPVLSLSKDPWLKEGMIKFQVGHL